MSPGISGCWKNVVRHHVQLLTKFALDDSLHHADKIQYDLVPSNVLMLDDDAILANLIILLEQERDDDGPSVALNDAHARANPCDFK